MAARLDEIAEGVANVLIHSATPEPLSIDLRNHSPVEASFFVRAVTDACERQGAGLARVRIGAELGERLLRAVELEPLEGGAEVDVGEELGRSIEFFRAAPRSF